MTALALLFIGYTLFCALALAVTHFRRERYLAAPAARVAGLVLLAALASLQLVHFGRLYLGDATLTAAWPYRLALFVVAPAFFLFAQPLLRPAGSSRAWTRAGHAVPVLAGLGLPGTVAMPLAFVVGIAYLIWLGRSLFALRAQRSQFHRERVLLGFTVFIAALVAGFGALPGQVGDGFFALYGCAIGAALLLVQITLGLRPDLAEEVNEVAVRSMPVSALRQLDCADVLQRLDALMAGEQLYRDAELKLPTLAARLELTTHQLSGLLNDVLGKGYARYLRELRVAAARQMLLAEPDASVLSVGLNVGFASQSGFYDAFREIEGMTPGQFRKLAGRQAS